LERIWPQQKVKGTPQPEFDDDIESLHDSWAISNNGSRSSSSQSFSVPQPIFPSQEPMIVQPSAPPSNGSQSQWSHNRLPPNQPPNPQDLGGQPSAPRQRVRTPQPQPQPQTNQQVPPQPLRQEEKGGGGGAPQPLRQEEKGGGGSAPTSGEQKIYVALINLASDIYDLAVMMKSYQYPTREETKTRLEQRTYSTGGSRRKGKSAGGQVQSVLEDIQDISDSLDPLHLDINEAQKLCYFKEAYNDLSITHKENKEYMQLQRISNRKEELRKMRNKRERARKRMERERDADMYDVFNQLSRDHRWH